MFRKQSHSQVLEELLEASDKGQPLYADSAYYKEQRNEELKKRGFIPKILSKGYRNKELTKSQIKRNHKLSSNRCRVEHIFAWLKQKSGHFTRGIGITRITARTTLRLIGYNLSRAVHLIKDRKRGLYYI